jgi:hypothetical protein
LVPEVPFHVSLVGYGLPSSMRKKSPGSVKLVSLAAILAFICKIRTCMP